MVKVSILTVCLNAGRTIDATIRSVLSQDYENTQYIIIDCLSTDNTMEVVNSYSERISVIISEKDNGIYDAINKGITLAEGDIVGLINADDVFANAHVVSNIAHAFEHRADLMSVIGDVAFLNAEDKVIRYYSAKNWRPSHFLFGIMPPHPSFYCRREVYFKYGLYSTDFEIGADYELLLRLLRIHKITYQYISGVMLYMKMGGVSTRGFQSLKVINKEIVKISKMHGMKINYWLVYLRVFSKIFQFVLPKQKCR